MRFRGKSVRRKIIALLLVPLLSLVSIWAFATWITAQEARQLLAVSSVSDNLGKPAEAVVHALQDERRQTLVYLADPRSQAALDEVRAATDVAVEEVQRNADGQARDDLNSGAAQRLDAMLDGLARVEHLRQQVDTNTTTRTSALESYSTIIVPGLRFQSVLHLLEDVELDRHGRAIVGLSYAGEQLSRSDALIAGVLAAEKMTGLESRTLTESMAERRLSYSLHLPELPIEDRQAHESFWAGHGQSLISAEEAVLTHGIKGVQRQRWDHMNAYAREHLMELAAEAGDRYQDEVGPAATAVLTRAAVAGIAGLLAVLISVVVSVRVGRSLIRDLRQLWREARESAGVRLPSVMRRLADGERVDVETEVPRLEYGRDEVGQVGQALNTLQRAAVEAAVQQAEMRRGVSDVFVNLARRNQVLLHRQLSLLDTMERRTEDADELADLFRLDHLTTRMRRHAEGLVILSGAAPARQWRKPVQLMDVVRAAVAEVEDYERIEVRRMPRLAVSGNAVADITHLVAELLENATAFSPPHTAVQVHGERVPQGFSLEIHDRGLGMTAEALAAANHRLAETPDFELSDTDRLGLFVVSRLAQRHQVRVALGESPYGGTTAMLLIPNEVLTEAVAGAEDHAPLPDRPAPPALLNGPVDGPVELEAPVSAPGGEAEYRGQAEHAAVTDQEPLLPLPQRRRAPVLVAENGRQVRRIPTADTAERWQQPEAAPADGVPAEPSGPDPTASGLPRRIRQAGLAPQLKHAGAAPEDRIGGEGRVPEADADEVRDRMASLQRGWQRGRQQNDSRPGEYPPGTNAREGQEP
jgi:anti-sigma regulatory factor (Ser/Thr protein kinase)